MDIFIILFILFVAVAVLAPFVGVDSRQLDDHPWEVPWERLPRDPDSAGSADSDNPAASTRPDWIARDWPVLPR